MQNSIEGKVTFLEGTRKDAEKILAAEASTNEYIVHLNNALASVETLSGRREIADYGIEKVRDEENEKLASYFFVLSSLQSFSPTARDFFTDVMVHCEDQMGPIKNAAVIRNTYKKIRPVL